MAFVALMYSPRRRTVSEISAGMVLYGKAEDAALMIYFRAEVMDRTKLCEMQSVRVDLGEGEHEGLLRLVFTHAGVADGPQYFPLLHNPRGGKSARLRVRAIPRLGPQERKTAACEMVSYARYADEMILRLPREWFSGGGVQDDAPPAPRERGWQSEPIVEAAKVVAAPVKTAPAAVKPIKTAPPVDAPAPKRAESVKNEAPAPKLAAMKPEVVQLIESAKLHVDVHLATAKLPQDFEFDQIRIAEGRDASTISVAGGGSVEVSPRGGTLVFHAARARGEIVDVNLLMKEIYGATTPDKLQLLRILAGDVKSQLARIGLDLVYVKPVGFRLRAGEP